MLRSDSHGRKPTIELVNLPRIWTRLRLRRFLPKMGRKGRRGASRPIKRPGCGRNGDLMVADGRSVPPILPRKRLTKAKNGGFGQFSDSPLIESQDGDRSFPQGNGALVWSAKTQEP